MKEKHLPFKVGVGVPENCYRHVLRSGMGPEVKDSCGFFEELRSRKGSSVMYCELYGALLEVDISNPNIMTPGTVEIPMVMTVKPCGKCLKERKGA